MKNGKTWRKEEGKKVSQKGKMKVKQGKTESKTEGRQGRSNKETKRKKAGRGGNTNEWTFLKRKGGAKGWKQAGEKEGSQNKNRKIKDNVRKPKKTSENLGNHSSPMTAYRNLENLWNLATATENLRKPGTVTTWETSDTLRQARDTEEHSRNQMKTYWKPRKPRVV